jgi:hypothetical protein
MEKGIAKYDLILSIKQIIGLPIAVASPQCQVCCGFAF